MKSKGSSSSKKTYRGEPEQKLISSKTFYRTYEFNNDLLTKVNCDQIKEELEELSYDNSSIKVRAEDGRRHIEVEDEERLTKLKVKIYLKEGEGENRVYAIKFKKTQGSLKDYYDLLSDVKAYLENIVLED